MSEINYLWDELEDNVIEEFDENGDTVVAYTTEPMLYGTVLTHARGNEIRHYHFDGQENTTALTNENGTKTDSRAYSAFGVITHATGSTSFPYAYVGGEGYWTDDGLPHYYVRRRILTTLGRWLSVDPLPRIETYNAYLYTNSPIVTNDPSGLWPVACRQTCIRPGKGIINAGPRGGTLSASILETVPARPGQVRTDMQAIFDFLNTPTWREYWHEPNPKYPAPLTFDQCCCCCDSLNWVQVHITSVVAPEPEKTAFIQSAGLPPPNVPFIDKGIPYPRSFALSPCQQSAPAGIPAPRWGSIGDGPRLEGVDLFFKKYKGQSISQSFFACVYCAGGVEGYRPTVPFMVTYCCFEWGHRVTPGPGGSLHVVRWVGGLQWVRDEDPKIPLPPAVWKPRFTVPCGGPSRFFVNAVEAERFFPPK